MEAINFNYTKESRYDAIFVLKIQMTCKNTDINPSKNKER
jgi:hypothetical protein